MIEVSVRKGSIAVTGHAKFAPPGQDIVCSAISTLFQTMVASIEALTGDIIEYDINPGFSWMKYKNLSDASVFLVDSFFIGICGVAEAYPENVTIK